MSPLLFIIAPCLILAFLAGAALSSATDRKPHPPSNLYSRRRR